MRFSIFRRPSTKPPLDEAEWALLAAALRAAPTPARPRDFQLSAADARRLTPARRARPWGPRPALAGGLAAAALLLAAGSLRSWPPSEASPSRGGLTTLPAAAPFASLQTQGVGQPGIAPAEAGAVAGAAAGSPAPREGLAATVVGHCPDGRAILLIEGQRYTTDRPAAWGMGTPARFSPSGAAAGLVTVAAISQPVSRLDPPCPIR